MENTKIQDNLLILLDVNIHCFLIAENYDMIKHTNLIQFNENYKDYAKLSEKKSSKYYKRNLKVVLDKIMVNIDNILNTDFNTIFNTNEDDTFKMIEDYRIFMRYIVLQKVPDISVLNELIISYNENSKFVGSICKKIIKNHKEEETNKSDLSNDKAELLVLLDLLVNLLFVRSKISKIFVKDYNSNNVISFINQFESMVKIIIKQDFQKVLGINENNSIEFYNKMINAFEDYRIDQKIATAQLVESWNKDEKAITGTIKKWHKLT